MVTSCPESSDFILIHRSESQNQPTDRNVMLASRRVNTPTLITETIGQVTIYGSRVEETEYSASDRKLIRNRLRRQQRKARRSRIKINTDIRRTRDQATQRRIIVKNSVKLQRRAIRGYWKSGIGRATEASLADQQLLECAVTSKAKNEILLGRKVSYERDRMRKQMSYAFKRARFALQLLQQKDMMTFDDTQDVKLIEKQDIDSIVLQKKIVRQ